MNSTINTLPATALLPEMAVFARVVQFKSFTGAAQSLGLTRSAVSKQVSRLEQALGAKLLHRTTRSLSLTEAGSAVAEHCARMLAEAEDAALAAGQLASAPRGKLRISTSVAFGKLQLAPLLPEFLARYPNITVEITLADRLVDMAEEGFDLALRLSETLPPNVVAKRLAPIDYVVCAAPAYLARNGTPKLPADIAKHNCLYYRHGALIHDHWVFEAMSETGGKRIEVPVQGNFQVNSSEILRDLTLSGMGLAMLPTFAVGPDLERGTLRAVLKRYRALGAFGSAVYALYPPSRYPLPKTRVFVDFLQEKMAEQA